MSKDGELPRSSSTSRLTALRDSVTDLSRRAPYRASSAVPSGDRRYLSSDKEGGTEDENHLAYGYHPSLPSFPARPRQNSSAGNHEASNDRANHRIIGRPQREVEDTEAHHQSFAYSRRRSNRSGIETPPKLPPRATSSSPPLLRRQAPFRHATSRTSSEQAYGSDASEHMKAGSYPARSSVEVNEGVQRSGVTYSHNDGSESASTTRTGTSFKGNFDWQEGLEMQHKSGLYGVRDTINPPSPVPWPALPPRPGSHVSSLPITGAFLRPRPALTHQQQLEDRVEKHVNSLTWSDLEAADPNGDVRNVFAGGEKANNMDGLGRDNDHPPGMSVWQYLEFRKHLIEHARTALSSEQDYISTEIDEAVRVSRPTIVITVHPRYSASSQVTNHISFDDYRVKVGVKDPILRAWLKSQKEEKEQYRSREVQRRGSSASSMIWKIGSRPGSRFSSRVGSRSSSRKPQEERECETDDVLHELKCAESFGYIKGKTSKEEKQKVKLDDINLKEMSREIVTVLKQTWPHPSFWPQEHQRSLLLDLGLSQRDASRNLALRAQDHMDRVRRIAGFDRGEESQAGGSFGPSLFHDYPGVDVVFEPLEDDSVAGYDEDTVGLKSWDEWRTSLSLNRRLRKVRAEL